MNITTLQHSEEKEQIQEDGILIIAAGFDITLFRIIQK